jgi:hypothetical protein
MMTESLCERVVGKVEQEAPPPVYAFLWTPLVRLDEQAMIFKVVAFVAGMAQLAATDVFLVALGLLVLSGLTDWHYGGQAARVRGDFLSTVSAWGFHTKVAGLCLVVLLRLGEYLLLVASAADTRGWLAVSIAFALFLHDLQSVDRHRQTMGGGPIPLLSTVLAHLAHLQQHLLPPALQAPPEPSRPASRLATAEQRGGTQGHVAAEAEENATGAPKEP